MRHELLRGIPKPDEWVVSRYFTEFQLWASQVRDPEKDLQAIKPGQKIPWATLLQVFPMLDVWIGVEKRLYGDIVTPTLIEYDEFRRRRIMLYA